MKPSPKKKTVKKQTRTTENKSDFKIQPLGDKVLIKESNENGEMKTASGIIIPITAQEEKSGKRGQVVAIGSGRIEDGEVVPMSVKRGDHVLFQWGDKMKVDDE